jgi:hypothetical protein
VVSAIPSFPFLSHHINNMQTCSVLVAIGGSNDTVILKEGVTVPEVIVLMAGHGRHSVTRVPNTLIEREGGEVTAKVECDRLVRAYGEETVALAFGANRFNLTLPTEFDAIEFKEVDPYAGITPVEKDVVETPEEEPVPVKKGSKKSVTPLDA